MATEFQAVILVTVHRRYHELRKNLERTREVCLAELGYFPPVVIVWACPVVGHLWLFQGLEKDGLLTHLLKRPNLPGEGEALGGATTEYEAQNIRIGLEFCRDHYKDAVVIMHAADVWLQEGTIGMFRHETHAGHDAVVFHWQNGCVASGAWHTNCWAVRAGSPGLWPPLSPRGEQDVLERQWGKALEGKPAVFGWHNSGQRRFLHRHESEELPPLQMKTQMEAETLLFTATGYLPWYSRLRLWIQAKAKTWYYWFGEPVWPQE